ncbi:RNA-directed DNA polymerase, eukaryota, reverse transcriptase zinc-binding domain protein [Tanacetum coccineum]
MVKSARSSGAVLLVSFSKSAATSAKWRTTSETTERHHICWGIVGTTFLVPVIKAVHGKDGSIGVNVKNVSNSVWLNIIREINVLSEKGINLMNQLRIKLGNGEMTHFWDDNWCEGGRLKDRFPRIYALEECKDITVGSKLAQPSITQSFRRMPRGGVKQMQVDDLINLVQNISLIPMQDRWTWTLNSSGDFSVASVRSYIDTTMLPKGDYQTRWVNLVPIKVNTFAWKVMTNSLPTRFNISRRGIDIDSISCGNCDSGVETATHLFFACDLAKQITRSIMRWWDVPEMDYESYNDWRTWMINVRWWDMTWPHISSYEEWLSWLKDIRLDSNLIHVEVETAKLKLKYLNAREVTISCTIRQKPLALPWGRAPRLDSGVKTYVKSSIPDIHKQRLILDRGSPRPIASLKKLYLASINQIKCWEVTKNGTSVSSVARESIAHDQPILSSAWKDDGLTVFNGGCDKQVKIWDPGIKIVFRQHLEDKVVSEEVGSELCSNLMFQLGKTGAHVEAQETPVINDLTMVISSISQVLVDAECTHDGSIKHIQKFENWGWTTLERHVLDAERTDDLTVLQEDTLFTALAELLEIDGSKCWPCKPHLRKAKWVLNGHVVAQLNSLLALCLLKPLGFR